MPYEIDFGRGQRGAERVNLNQLTKFKNRLLNIQTQLQGGSLALGKSTTEQQINTKLLQATKLVKDALEMSDGIETKEVTKAEQKKIRKKIESRYSDLTPHNVIIQRVEPPTYNLRCRNYGEVRYKDGRIERTCVVGMDMCYCSKNCAYATNNVCSLKG